MTVYEIRSGQTYETIAAFEAGSGDGDEAVLFASESPYNEQVTFSGHTGRIISINPGDEYDRSDLSGVVWRAGSSDRYVLRAEEPLTVRGGLLLESHYTGTQDSQVFRSHSGSGTHLTGVMVRYATATSGSNKRGFYIHTNGDSTVLNSCIALGNAGNPITYMNIGFAVLGDDAELYNCGAYDVDDGTVGTGFDIDNASATVRNCWAYGSAVNDFDTVASVTESHNVSSDSTATGTGSITTATDTSDMTDPSSDPSGGDFTPKRGGNLIDNGAAVSGADNDWNGDDHDNDGGGREIGPYNFDTRQQIAAAITNEADLTAFVARGRVIAADIENEADIAAFVPRGRALAASITNEAEITASVPRVTRISSAIENGAQILGALQAIEAAVTGATLTPAAQHSHAGVQAAEAGAVARAEAAQAAHAGVQAAEASHAGAQAAQPSHAAAEAAQEG